MNNIKIKSVVLHTSMEIPGLESGLSLNRTKYPGLEMELVPGFLKVDIRGITAIIPTTNIKFLLYENQA